MTSNSLKFIESPNVKGQIELKSMKVNSEKESAYLKFRTKQIKISYFILYKLIWEKATYFKVIKLYYIISKIIRNLPKGTANLKITEVLCTTSFNPKMETTNSN
jgi:hypothetical protein